jgi:hypothetical protein
MSEGRPSRAFWPAVVVGASLAAVGARIAFGAPGDDGRPLGIAAVVAGLVLAHDCVIAPISHRIGVLVSRRWPPAVAGPVRAALATSAIVVVFAVPLVAGLGRRPTNSSTLPLHYGWSLLVLLAVIWTVTAGVIAFRRRRP